MTNEIIDYIKIEEPNINYREIISVTGKFCVLTGDSATGKSSLAESLLYAKDTVTSNKNVTVLTSLNLFSAIKTCGENDIFVIDDEMLGRLPNWARNVMNTSKCRFLLIMRDAPVGIPIDYRDVYKIERCADGCFRNIRLYKDYNSFNRCTSYVTEDKASGHQYFASLLDNVVPAGGISNIQYYIDSTECAIVDGAACGAYMKDLYRFRYLYAPISFEYLCCKELWSDFEIPVDWWKSYKSTEAYCTEYLTKHLHEFGENYSKSRCPRVLMDRVIIPELKIGEKLRQYADSLFNGDIEKAFGQLQEEYNITTYEETEDLLKYIKF